MDFEDCELMNTAYDETPWYIDSLGISLCRRPRLYWVSWELLEGEGVTFQYGSDGQLPLMGDVTLNANVENN